MKRLFAAGIVVIGSSALAQPAALPPDHPAIPPGTSASPAKPTGMQPLPPDHPPIAGAAREDATAGMKTAEELIRELDQNEALEASDKPFQVAASLGKLYYANGRTAEAVLYLRQAAEKGEPLRKLYLSQLGRAKAQRKDLPPPSTVGCPTDATTTVETYHEVASGMAKRGESAAAASCARHGLTPVVQIRNVLAGALFIQGDVAAARAVLEDTLAAAPDDPDALFSHASILLETRGDDLKALEQAKAEFERVLTLRPDSPRAGWTRKLAARAQEAIDAGGLTKLEAKKAAEARAGAPAAGATAQADTRPAAATAQGGMPAPLSREAIEAFQNTEITPEMEAGFRKLVEEGEEHLARGRYQEALNNYRQVVPFKPNDGRVRAGMAWALVGLNRQPMADNIWRVAVGSDPGAMDALGRTLQAKGDTAGATALWTKLAESDPVYAARSGLNARLKP